MASSVAICRSWLLLRMHVICACACAPAPASACASCLYFAVGFHAQPNEAAESAQYKE